MVDMQSYHPFPQEGISYSLVTLADRMAPKALVGVIHHLHTVVYLLIKACDFIETHVQSGYSLLFLGFIMSI